MTSPRLLHYQARAAAQASKLQAQRPTQTIEGQLRAPVLHRLSELGTPIQWAGDTLGAFVLVALVILSFVLLPLLSNTADVITRIQP